MCVCEWLKLSLTEKETHTLTHPLPSSLLSPPPSLPPCSLLQHTFVLFSLPPLPFPSHSSRDFSPFAPSCVLRRRASLRAERSLAFWDAADATAVWAPCLLRGPLTKTRLHVSRGISAQHSEKSFSFFFFFLAFLFLQQFPLLQPQLSPLRLWD